MKTITILLLFAFSIIGNAAGLYVDPATVPVPLTGWSGVQSAATTLTPIHRADNYGKFRMHTYFSHSNNDDAIVFPGMAGASHKHCYLHNTTANAFSTPESLHNGSTVGDGGTAIASAWWMPCMIDISDSSMVKYGVRHDGSLDGALVYQERGYRLSRNPAVSWFPYGLRMITGDAMATRPQWTNPSAYGATNVTYSCADAPGGNASPQVAYIPPCAQGRKIVITIAFQSCYDGRLDSPNHKDHLRYPPNWNCQDYATGNVRFYGTAGTVIPTGTIVLSSTGLQYATTAQVTIGSTGQATVAAKAKVGNMGGNLAVNTPLTLSSAIVGVNSVIALNVGGVTKNWYNIPQLTFIFGVAVTKPEGTANWRLVSDAPDSVPATAENLADPTKKIAGSSLHADAFEVDSAPIGQRIAEDCITANDDCGMKLIGDTGTILKSFYPQ